MQERVNHLVTSQLPVSMANLFKTAFEETDVFKNMNMEDTFAENYHLEVLTAFADRQGYVYCGVHLLRSLGSAIKEALNSGFTVGGRICAVLFDLESNEYSTCIINRKGEVLDPLSSGLNIGDNPLEMKLLYGWYIFRRK